MRETRIFLVLSAAFFLIGLNGCGRNNSGRSFNQEMACLGVAQSGLTFQFGNQLISGPFLFELLDTGEVVDQCIGRMDLELARFPMDFIISKAYYSPDNLPGSVSFRLTAMGDCRTTADDQVILEKMGEPLTWHHSYINDPACGLNNVHVFGAGLHYP